MGKKENRSPPVRSLCRVHFDFVGVGSRVQMRARQKMRVWCLYQLKWWLVVLSCNHSPSCDMAGHSQALQSTNNHQFTHLRLTSWFAPLFLLCENSGVKRGGNPRAQTYHPPSALVRPKKRIHNGCPSTDFSTWAGCDVKIVAVDLVFFCFTRNGWCSIICSMEIFLALCSDFAQCKSNSKQTLFSWLPTAPSIFHFWSRYVRRTTNLNV